MTQVANVTSLISRRSELFRFTPCRGALLEVCTAEQLAELEEYGGWYAYPSGYTRVTHVVVDDGSDWRAALTTLLPGFDVLAILPDVSDLSWVAEQGFSLLRAGGWIALAVAAPPFETLQALAVTGYQAVQAMAWGIGSGSYSFARVP